MHCEAGHSKRSQMKPLSIVFTLSLCVRNLSKNVKSLPNLSKYVKSLPNLSRNLSQLSIITRGIPTLEFGENSPKMEVYAKNGLKEPKPLLGTEPFWVEGCWTEPERSSRARTSHASTEPERSAPFGSDLFFSNGYRTFSSDGLPNPRFWPSDRALGLSLAFAFFFWLAFASGSAPAWPNLGLGTEPRPRTERSRWECFFSRFSTKFAF